MQNNVCMGSLSVISPKTAELWPKSVSIPTLAKKFRFLGELADFDNNLAILGPITLKLRMHKLFCVLFPINMQPNGNQDISEPRLGPTTGQNTFRIYLQTKEFCLKFFIKVIFMLVLAELQT